MKDKTTAWLLAIFFGWLGLHKVYLWKYWQFFMYLILACTWVGIFITFIVSFFEWCFYIWESKKKFDEEFNLDFMLKKKQLESLYDKD